MAKVKGMYSKDDLAGLLLPKLREIAKSLGIRRVEQYKKKELTEKILETEQNKQNGTTGASGDEGNNVIAKEEAPAQTEAKPALSAQEREDLIAKTFSKFKVDVPEENEKIGRAHV